MISFIRADTAAMDVTPTVRAIEPVATPVRHSLPSRATGL